MRVELKYKTTITVLIVIAATILVLLCLLAIRVFHPGDEAAVGIFSLAATLVGTIFIAVELKNGAEVTCSQMLIDLNNYFHESDRLMKVYQVLEECEADKDYSSRHWEGVSSVDIAQYCTFFENLYLLYRHHIATIEDLDDLFGYRFFIFVNNPYIQENYIFPTSSSYVQIFELYRVWITHREEENNGAEEGQHYVPCCEYIIPAEYLRNKWYLQDYGTEGYNKELMHFEAKGHAFTMRQLGFDSIPALLALQDKVVAAIADKETFYPLSRAELLESIQLDAVAGIYTEREHLVSFAVLVMNRNGSRSLAHDGGVRENECMTFDGVVTDVEWRGYEFQQRFIDWMTEVAKERQVSTILATVAPTNEASKTNMEQKGFTISRTITKYNGLKRLLMQKTLLLALLMTLFCAPMVAEDVVYITTEQFKERIFDYKNNKEWSYNGDKPCVIDFYTTWCGPCKRLAPIMEELSQTYCDQVVFYKADTERERELAYVFGINSIPQVLYIPTEGRPMLLRGLYPKDEIIRIIDEFLLKKE